MAIVNVTSVSLVTIQVPIDSVFTVGPDAITINDTVYHYESYNKATGVFTFVQPDPLGSVLAGAIVKQSSLEERRTDQAYDRLASKFPKRYNIKTNPYVKGLVKALSKGDGFIDYQVDAVHDNSLVIRAQGKYLDRLASLYGVIRGQATGVQDSDFQQLVPLIGMSAKQVAITLNKIIDVIYGPFASHANITCSLPGPYALYNNWTLDLRVDGTQYSIKFQTEDFINISTASALEIANTIIQQTNGRVLADVITNMRTGEEYVNVRSATIGSQGFIQVLGGDAQSVMKFPAIRNTIQDIAIWDVTRADGSDSMLYTVVSGISPAMQNAGVSRGDYVTIRPDSGFSQANTGSYLVIKADNNSFIIKNSNGVPESGITNSNNDDLTFFKSNTANILLSSRPATVIETAVDEVTVILPVTSPLVKRTLKGSHHLHGGISIVNSVTSNSMTLGSAIGFPSSDGVMPTASRDTASDIVSSITSNSITLISGDGFPTKGAIWSQTSNSFFYYSGRSGNVLQNVIPTPQTVIVGAECKYEHRYSYSSITGSTLNGVYPDPSDLINQEVTNGSSEIIDGFPGSFLYDSTSQFMLSSVSCNLAETVTQGSSRTVVNVTSNAGFPDVGFLIFRNGESHQEGPVRYFAKVGTTGLIIDPGHIFENTHLTGSRMRVIRQIGAYKPRENGQDLAIYLTSTSPARDLIAKYLRDIAAAGVVLKFEIRLPDYKWPVLPGLYVTNPLDTVLVPPTVS